MTRILGVDDEQLLEALKRVNPHYRISRYPDAANGVPMDVYSESMAGELVGLAKKVVEWTKKRLEE